jgi:hypothetical protein
MTEVVVTSKEIQKVLDVVVGLCDPQDLSAFLSILCLSYIVGCRLNGLTDDQIEDSVGKALLIESEFVQ